MKRLGLALSAAALALAGAAYAAPDGGRMMDPMGDKTVTRAEAEAKAREMFDKLDANHDGKLDKADREARLLEQFRKIDTDGNGSISQAEFLAAHQRKLGEGPMAMGAGRPGHEGMDHDRMGPGGMDRGGMGAPGMGRMAMRHPMMAMMMLRMADTNKDGAVSRDEFVAAMLAHFDKADANHDGKVTPEERAAAHKAMAERMKAMRGKHMMGGMGGGMPMGDGPPPPPGH